MINELDVGVAELYEATNLLLRRRQWHVRNSLDFLCRN
jgi:hypothetical protein